ncbi:MAG TPA: hypothetical protein VFY66_17620, partial [Anaerolineales bacterium]|nr:hypothetical protein [Anaerolineales bacterium]
MKPLQPVFFITALVLLVGLACSALTGGGTPPTQPPPPTQEPVQVLPTATEPEPTEPPATEAPVTEAAPPTEEAPATSEFFTEEFDSEDALANWDSFSLGSGEDNNLVIQQEDDHLLFDLGDEDLYVYYMYTPYEYDDVSIKLNA